MNRIRIAWVVVAVVVLVSAGCGGGDDDGPDGDGAASTTTTVAEAPTTTSSVPIARDSLPPIVGMDESGAQSIEAGRDADWVTIANEAAWVANVGGGVRRYDVTTAAEVGTAPVPGYICQAMDVGFDSLWASDCDNGTVVRIDLATGAVVATIDPGDGGLIPESSIAVDATGVYVLFNDRHVARIDPATNTLAGTFAAPEGAAAIRSGFGSLWFSRATSGELTRVDPVDGAELATVPAGAGARFLAVGEDAVWVMANNDATVTRVDADNNVVATITVGDRPVEGGDIAVGGGYVWARVTDSVVVQIDEATNEVVARFGEPAGSGSVAAADGVAWISAHDISTVWRLPVE